MGDTCNGERKAKRLVASAAEAAKRLEIGDEAWEAMSEDARTTSCKAYIGDCHNHLRNIIVNAMATSATDLLKNALEDDLAEFSSFDRMERGRHGSHPQRVQGAPSGRRVRQGQGAREQGVGREGTLMSSRTEPLISEGGESD